MLYNRLLPAVQLLFCINIQPSCIPYVYFFHGRIIILFIIHEVGYLFEIHVRLILWFTYPLLNFPPYQRGKADAVCKGGLPFSSVENTAYKNPKAL
jgi:hypothetical protein